MSLYCYKEKDIFWKDSERVKLKVFHVTPYASEILKSGALKPPSQTGNMVLGENIRAGFASIRGHLLSFFDSYQTALTGCYSLALYAILAKRLLTQEQFDALIAYKIASEGLTFEFLEEELSRPHTEGNPPTVEGVESTTRQVLSTMYKIDELEGLMILFERCLGIPNPRILASTWVQDLPNSIEGVLEAIGIFEIEVERKFILDPSVFYCGCKGVYGFVSSKGDLGEDFFSITDLVLSDDETPEQQIFLSIEHKGSELARMVNRLLDKDSKTTLLKDEDFPITLEQEIHPEIFFEEGAIESISKTYGETLEIPNEITFVEKVRFDPSDCALWNCIEEEWRVPISEIPITSKNLIATAKDVFESQKKGLDDLAIPFGFERGTAVKGRVNPRKIEVNHQLTTQIVNTLNQNFKARLQNAIQMYKTAHFPLGNWLKLYITLPKNTFTYVDGTPIAQPVLIALESVPKGGSSCLGLSPQLNADPNAVILQAAMASEKDPDNPKELRRHIINIILNGELFAEDFLTDVDMEREFNLPIYQRVIHELTHLREQKFRKDVSYDGASQETYWRKYFNDPYEVRAHLQEIIFEVRNRKSDFYRDGAYKRPFKFLEGYSETWRTISMFLNPRNKRLIVSALVSEFED